MDKLVCESIVKLLVFFVKVVIVCLLVCSKLWIINKVFILGYGFSSRWFDFDIDFS